MLQHFSLLSFYSLVRSAFDIASVIGQSQPLASNHINSYIHRHPLQNGGWRFRRSESNKVFQIFYLGESVPKKVNFPMNVKQNKRSSMRRKITKEILFTMPKIIQNLLSLSIYIWPYIRPATFRSC